MRGRILSVDQIHVGIIGDGRMTEIKQERPQYQEQNVNTSSLNLTPANEDSLSALKVPSRIQPGAEVSEHLILMGGGAKPKEALNALVELAGGKDAKILVITWATKDATDAHETFDALEESLEQYKPRSVDESPLRTDMDRSYERKKFLRQLEDATGVFFTGGNQERIMEVLADKEILKALHAKFAEGTVFSGTSAGTAIMSEQMILGGDMKGMDAGTMRMGPGLGLLRGDVGIDQHFLARPERMQRLMVLLMSQELESGIGVPEDGAVLIEDSHFAKPLGDKPLVVMQRKEARYTVDVVAPGKSFDLKTGDYIEPHEEPKAATA